MKGEYNEIIISEEGSVADYAAYCNGLLQVGCNEDFLQFGILIHGTSPCVGRCNAFCIPKVCRGGTSAQGPSGSGGDQEDKVQSRSVLVVQ